MACGSAGSPSPHNQGWCYTGATNSSGCIMTPCFVTAQDVINAINSNQVRIEPHGGGPLRFMKNKELRAFKASNVYRNFLTAADQESQSVSNVSFTDADGRLVKSYRKSETVAVTGESCSGSDCCEDCSNKNLRKILTFVAVVVGGTILLVTKPWQQFSK